MNLPCTKKPCLDCPFRKDTERGWLKLRIDKILESESFTCHKTEDPNRLQCAGHLILKKEENVFYRTAKRMGISIELKGHELIFDTKESCAKHHKNE